MKRIMMAGAALLLSTGAATAQLAVADPVTHTALFESLVNDVTAAAKRLAMVNNQLIQIQHLITTANAVAHGNIAALGTLSAELGGPGLTMPLANDLGALASSVGGLASAAGTTGALARDVLRTDQFHAPTGRDFNAMSLLRQAQALSVQKAAAQQAYDSATQRLTSLATLRGSLGATRDIKDSSDATARLAGEQATAQAQTNQLLAMMIMQNAEKETTDARRRQAERCAAEQFLANAEAATRQARAGTVSLFSTPVQTNNCNAP